MSAWAAFLAAHGTEPLWAGRAHYQQALLLDHIPHQGYKVGTRVYRGGDYPHVTGAEKPEYVWLQNEDTQAMLADFEAAVVEYDRVGVPPAPNSGGVRKGPSPVGAPLAAPSPLPLLRSDFPKIGGRGDSGPVYLQIKDPDGGYQNTPRVDPLAGEKTDLYFDLARFLPNAQPWGSEEDWKAAKTMKAADWTVRVGGAYDPKWPQPKKVLFLLTRVPTFNPADAHVTVLAMLAKGLYVAQYRSSWARQEYVVPPGHPEKGHQQIVQTLPYFTIDPFPILSKAADASPDDPQAPQIRLILAQWTERAGDFVGALKRYKALTARYPTCKWAPDARQAAQDIQRPSVSVSVNGPQHADEAASVTVGSRNVKTITLRAYRVPLAAVLSGPGKLEDPLNKMGDFTKNFGSIEAARKLGPQVASWTQATGDTGEFAYYNETLKTPLTKAGAYLVVADGQEGQTRGAAVVLISDLARPEEDRQGPRAVLRRRRPLRQAPLRVRTSSSAKPGTSAAPPYVKVRRGTTDGDGLLTVPSVQNQQQIQTEAFASAPGERYALTGQNYWWNGNNNDTRDEIKVYAYTDRPVYRPKQTVYFRQMLARRAGGGSDYAPACRHTGPRHRHQPQGRRGVRQNAGLLRVRHRKRLVRPAGRGRAGRVQRLRPGRPRAGQRLRVGRQPVPGGGVQAARVRGQGHAEHDPGPVRRQGDGDGHGDPVFRPARGGGQGRL